MNDMDYLPNRHELKVIRDLPRRKLYPRRRVARTKSVTRIYLGDGEIPRIEEIMSEEVYLGTWEIKEVVTEVVRDRNGVYWTKITEILTQRCPTLKEILRSGPPVELNDGDNE